MQYTPCNFSIDQLVADLERIQAGNRLFRIYAHAPNLFELLVSLENELSGQENHNRNSPDNATWEDILKKIRTLYLSVDDNLCRQHYLFYFGQIAMLLDCLSTREQVHRAGLVRMFA